MLRKKLEDLEAQPENQKVTKPDAEVVVPASSPRYKESKIRFRSRYKRLKI